MKIGLIKPYEKNAKKHPAKQIKQVAESIKAFGFNQPIVVDKNGVIIVGHGRYEAAKLLGLKDVPAIKVNLTEEQAKAYRLADNKLNESEWDMGLAIEDLKGLSDEMFDLTGFDKDLLIEPDEKDDEIPENAPTRAKLGDIWQLGRHRVMCGDSTDKASVERLMGGKLADCVVTDPPYNTGMSGKEMKVTKQGDRVRLDHFFNDDLSEEDWTSLITKSTQLAFDNTKGECAFYVFIDWRRAGQVKSIVESLMDVKNVIVWDKVVHGLGSDYKSTYELCVVGKKGKPQINNRYGLDYQDIWRLQRTMGRNKDHATAKPIELLEKPIKHASKQDDIILDLFLGSGSTLIASEKTGRICYGCEIDPKYVDTIIKRWEDYTHGKAEKL